MSESNDGKYLISVIKQGRYYIISSRLDYEMTNTQKQTDAAIQTNLKEKKKKKN
jgi:hypothetical protein